MKKPFEDVLLSESGQVFEKDGTLIEPMFGVYPIGKKKYSIDRVKAICAELFADQKPAENKPEVKEFEQTDVKRNRVKRNEIVKRNTTMLNETCKLDENVKRKHSAEKNSRFKGYYLINGKKYSSAILAANELEISVPTVIRKCKGNIKGWSFLPV